MRFFRKFPSSFVLSVAILLAASFSPAGWAQSVCGAGIRIEGPQDEALRRFAHEHGIEYVEVFVVVVNTIHLTGRLPDCYVTKKMAERKGWREGRDLWEAAPGDAIGGNRFPNRQALLPLDYNGRYREADLDYDGGHRGAHRLVYVDESRGEWLVWVTTDHYRHVYRVPAPERVQVR